MDLLVSKKTNPANTQIMSEAVFGLNGGENEWDVLANSEEDGWDKTINASSDTKSTAKAQTQSVDERIKSAAQRANVLVGNSTVVAVPGELEAVLRAENETALVQQFNDLGVSDSGEQTDGDRLQSQLLQGNIQPGGPEVKILSLDAVNTLANVDTLTGNTQVIGDGSPEATNSMRQAEAAKPANTAKPASTPANKPGPKAATKPADSKPATQTP